MPRSDMESLRLSGVRVRFAPTMAAPRPVTTHSDYVLGFPQAPLAAFEAMVHGYLPAATAPLAKPLRA